MKTVFHKSLTFDIWCEKSIEYQILTIGAEFGRAKNLLNKNYIIETQNCMERALELLDLSISDPKWKAKLRELLRFREWTGEFYLNQTQNLKLCLQLYKCLLQFHPKTANLQI